MTLLLLTLLVHLILVSYTHHVVASYIHVFPRPTSSRYIHDPSPSTLHLVNTQISLRFCCDDRSTYDALSDRTTGIRHQQRYFRYVLSISSKTLLPAKSETQTNHNGNNEHDGAMIQKNQSLTDSSINSRRVNTSNVLSSSPAAAAATAIVPPGVSSTTLIVTRASTNDDYKRYNSSTNSSWNESDPNPNSNYKPLYLLDLQRLVRLTNTFTQFKALVLKSSTSTTTSSSNDDGVENDTTTLDTRTKTRVSFTTAAPISSLSSKVAFPQASILSDHDLRKGSIVASPLLFTLGSLILYPTMWLISAIVGGLYGRFIANTSIASSTTITNIQSLTSSTQDITTTLTTNQTLTTRTYNRPSKIQQFLSNNTYTRLVLKLGQIMAQTYLQIYEVIQGIWFMYRTGPLSYEYYKMYNEIDRT